MGLAAVAAQPMPGTSWYTGLISASLPERAHGAQLGWQGWHRHAMDTGVMERLTGTLVPGLGAQWRMGRRPCLAPRRWQGGRAAHMNSGSVPAGPFQRLSRPSAHSPAPPARDRGAATRMASGRDSANPHVSPCWGNAHGRGSGREEPHLGGNVHRFYHLLLSFDSQFPLKTHFCVFPLLPFEEKPAAGCLLCSAKSSYELFSKKIRVRRGILLKRDAFWGRRGSRGRD